jgi:tetratricopeptide (TPR) repeat protein
MKICILIVLSLILFSCNITKEDDGQKELKELYKLELYKAVSDSIKKFPEADTLYFNRGTILTQNKEYEAALKDFEKAWKLNQDDKNGFFLSVAYINLNLFKDASILLGQLSNSYPNNLLVRERLAYCLEQTNQFNEAIKQYDFILSKDDSDFVTMATKGYALQQIGNDNEAMKWLEKSYNLVPNKTIGNELAIMFAEAKNSKTIALCDELIKADNLDSSKKTVQPIYTKGRYYKNIGNNALAMQYFEQCIKEDYTFPYSYLDKSILLYEQKNYEEALRVLILTKQIANQNSEVYYRTGRCLEALGQKEAAIQEYESAIALDKDYKVAIEALEEIKKQK